MEGVATEVGLTLAMELAANTAGSTLAPGATSDAATAAIAKQLAKNFGHKVGEQLGIFGAGTVLLAGRGTKQQLFFRASAPRMLDALGHLALAFGARSSQELEHPCLPGSSDHVRAVVLIPGFLHIFGFFSDFVLDLVCALEIPRLPVMTSVMALISRWPLNPSCWTFRWTSDVPGGAPSSPCT